MGVLTFLISIVVVGFYRSHHAGSTAAGAAVTAPRAPAAPGNPLATAAADATAPPATPVPAAPGVAVPGVGSGEVRVARFARAAPAGQAGRQVRVRVEVERDMPTDPEAAAAIAADVLQDARSWPATQRVRFDFVGEGPHDLVIRVLTPATTDRRCHPLKTFGEVSCSVGAAVNLNGARWEGGVPHFNGDLAGYRAYLVNHEVGHYLGFDHVGCPAPGAKAPIMMQQTKGLDGCLPNPWP